MRCAEVDCPAYNRMDSPCWRVPNTMCREHGGADYAQKLARCVICPVFKVHAERDPQGWSHLVSEQLVHLTQAVLTHAFQKDEIILPILNNMGDGLFTWDEQAKITYFNAAAAQITGIPETDALGMHCKDAFRTPVCETDCPFTISTHEATTFRKREFVITRVDGSPIPVICSTFVLRDLHGKVLGGVEIFRDISASKRLEDSLRISEGKYRRIFEGSKDMIFFTSNDGVINDVNQAGVELLGYRSKQALTSLISVENIYDNPMHWKVFKKQIDRDGFVKDFEASFKKRDGTPLHCLLSGNAVRDENGKIIGYEGIAKDITARMDAIRNLRQRHRELWVLTSVALAMNKTQDLDDILMTALKKVLEALNLTSGCIFLIDHQRPAFSLRVEQGLPKGWISRSHTLVLDDKLLMGSLLKEDLSLKPEPIFPPFRATLKCADSDEPVQLTCFLITAKEKASGFLALEVPPNRDITTGQDFHLLGSLGNFLGGATENARLLETIHRHREELKGLTAKLLYSQEEERKRIARELHDEAGQALTGINFALQTIEKELSAEPSAVKEYIADVKKQIDRTYQEMRHLSYRLHPALLSDLGLEPALEAYLGEVSKYSQLEIDFRMVGFEERLDPEVETVLYRISQEALTNSLKYSGAKRFRLSIIKSYPHIIFLAEDDGIGFDVEFSRTHKHALGLLTMRERAAMVGGNFSLRSSKGKGTRIRIEIPIKESSGGH
jgi:PAS domain S-box-containing protein